MNYSDLIIRLSKLTDLKEMQEIFVDSITKTCMYDYTPEQIIAWISSIENKQRWTEKLTLQYCLIAEQDNKMVGFASLEGNDYLDLLYVHKEYQGRGIAKRLYSEIEKEAINRKAIYLNSDVSKTARKFFEKQGFTRAIQQAVKIKDIVMINYKMSKQLCD